MSLSLHAIFSDTGRTQRSSNRRRRRPLLEGLEDRTVLSVVAPVDSVHHAMAGARADAVSSWNPHQAFNTPHHPTGPGGAHHLSPAASLATSKAGAGHAAAKGNAAGNHGAAKGNAAGNHTHHAARKVKTSHHHKKLAATTTPTTTAAPTSPTPSPTPSPTATAASVVTPSPTSTATSAPADPTLITLSLNPINLNLLGLNVQLYGQTVSSPVTVTVSAQPGSGQLLGNLLTDAAGLLNVQGVSNALDNVLNSVVGLVNQSSLSVPGQSGGTTVTSTTPVLDAYIAPVNLDLLGAIVTTSPINLVIQAQAGPGLALGNIVTDLANLLNKPTGNVVNDVENGLTSLLNTLDKQFPTISPSLPTPTSTTTTPTPTSTGSFQLLSLTVPPIDLNLLGLILQTSTIQVNATSQSANGDLLGNLINDLLNSVHASQSDLNTINSDLNGVLDKVIGVLNATTLSLPAGAVSSLSPTLQELASPTLIDTTGASVAPEPVLNLSIASPNSTTPPVNVNLLGVVVTTSDIQVQLLAQPGQGLILGNLVYNASHLLDGGLLSVLGLLNNLGV